MDPLPPSTPRPTYAVITLSDRAANGERADEAGPAACAMLSEAQELGCAPIETLVLPDEQPAIEAALKRLSDDAGCTLIVTTGGTGLSPRDVTPEATRAVIDREVPGLAEAIRAEGVKHTPFAVLSRGFCGLRSGPRGACLIINLSGSPKAVREQLAVVLPVLPHALKQAAGVLQDCAR